MVNNAMSRRVIFNADDFGVSTYGSIEWKEPVTLFFYCKLIIDFIVSEPGNSHMMYLATKLLSRKC